MNDEYYMLEALKEARKAYENDEVPVGAVVVKDGEIIGRGHNKREKMHDVSSHAEIEAMKNAADFLGDWKLDGCVLFVTLEPCLMCSGAILQSKIARVVFGAVDKNEGAIVSNYFVFDDPTHKNRPLVNFGILENECSSLLVKFFSAKR